MRCSATESLAAPSIKRRVTHVMGLASRKVKWSVPDGFKVADEPSMLNASLVLGSNVYLVRWAKYG